MRVYLLQDVAAQIFAQQLLDIGDRKLPIDPTTREISFPPNFCQMQSSIQNVVENVFPDITNNFKNHDWLCERAILAPKNNDVNKINHQIQLKLPGEVVKYKSIDTVIDEEQAVNYPIEFLNSLEPSGMPPHILTLKVGSPLMLIRNLDPPKLCNGTRLAAKKLSPNLIEATIISSKCKGEDVLIPRNDFYRFALRFQAITISSASGFCHNHQQGSRPIAKCYWFELRKFLFFARPIICCLLQS